MGGALTYADTLRKVRETEVDFNSLGTKVTSIRKTVSGVLIVELTKSNKSLAAVDVLRNKIAAVIPDSSVKCLRQTSEVEIVDLDEVTTKEEVHAALLKNSNADGSTISVTGIWRTRSGQQMATATVPVVVADKLTHVNIGWLRCRVRPRREQPQRCYKCHGFGHASRRCTGLDLTGACRRCGLSGHQEKTCSAGEDKCIMEGGIQGHRQRSEMINFLQINLNRSAAAQNLLAQTSAELGIHVLVVSEPNWIPLDRSRWILSGDGLCAVALTAPSSLVIRKYGSGLNFSWLQFDKARVHSVYFSRNCNPEEFLSFLRDLERSIRGTDEHLDIIVGGDFNAWSFEWGSDPNDHRGRLLADLATSLDITVCNAGSAPTYRRVNAATIIDVTFARLRTPSMVSNWQVLDQAYSGSDHQYIRFVLKSHDADEGAIAPLRE